MIVDISPLVGRHFVSKSSNVCRVARLDNGACRGTWETKPSAEDIAECNAWIDSVLGGDITLTVCMDPRKEKEDLAAWKQRTQ